VRCGDWKVKGLATDRLLGFSEAARTRRYFSSPNEWRARFRAVSQSEYAFVPLPTSLIGLGPERNTPGTVVQEQISDSAPLGPEPEVSPREGTARRLSISDLGSGKSPFGRSFLCRGRNERGSREPTSQLTAPRGGHSTSTAVALSPICGQRRHPDHDDASKAHVRFRRRGGVSVAPPPASPAVPSPARISVPGILVPAVSIPISGRCWFDSGNDRRR
jgi:hypothetical protein